MLIKLHVVRYRDSHEDIDEEIINMDHVARMSPCDIPDSLAKTYLFFPEQPMWQQLKVTESIDDILKITNKANYRKLAHDVGRGVRLLKPTKLTKEQFEELWENGYLKEAITDDDSGKRVHYVKVPENIIVIDFDLKDENGEKSAGVHLHYIYTG